MKRKFDETDKGINMVHRIENAKDTVFVISVLQGVFCEDVAIYLRS